MLKPQATRTQPGISPICGRILSQPREGSLTSCPPNAKAPTHHYRGAPARRVPYPLTSQEHRVHGHTKLDYYALKPMAEKWRKGMGLHLRVSLHYYRWHRCLEHLTMTFQPFPNAKHNLFFGLWYNVYPLYDFMNHTYSSAMKTCGRRRPWNLCLSP